MATTTSISSSTYFSPIQSSFPLAVALTTTFTPPNTCTGAYYSGGVFLLGEGAACKPSGFNDLSTQYFSPGLYCPSGYYTACHDTAGVASITTVTCCPFLEGSDTSLSCVNPAIRTSVLSSLYCTWVAPRSPDSASFWATFSTGGTTSTASQIFSSPGGLNAQGIRMVYQATDLETTAAATTTGTGSETTAAGTATATSTSTSPADDNSSDSSSSGISAGATVGIAVVVAVVGIGAIVGVFFWLRRKCKYGAVGSNSGRTTTTGGGGPASSYDNNNDADHKYTGPYAPGPTQELSGVGAHGVRNPHQELVELGRSEPRFELPAADTTNWR